MIYQQGVQELFDASVSINPDSSDLTITQLDDDWKLSLRLDAVAEELVLQAELKANTWLAIGIASDLVEADVI